MIDNTGTSPFFTFTLVRYTAASGAVTIATWPGSGSTYYQLPISGRPLSFTSIFQDTYNSTQSRQYWLQVTATAGGGAAVVRVPTTIQATELKR